ncbi:Zn-dependent hydrolase [Arthrobacter sp. PAMC 25486]|uniref:MBL fold metallo-hydrolase n=1 Tax=Arthrobacter sp. PAMC 25486 TaxID=1494608 RepID=UPI000535B0DB|nr:MBL fold metallo-hydrolase [Arthrobacter sp. PAMC 25486]AIY01902.1 Zn-dependent hydrolase [Arthrobacter sp. PAMC 25486]
MDDPHHRTFPRTGRAGWLVLGGGAYMLPSSADRALVNIGLILGSERALLIDTGAGPRHGTEILAAVRALTPLPLVIANTHAHWDHFFGNAVFLDEGTKYDGGTQFWAHVAAARAMAETGESQRAEVAGPEPEMSAGTGPGTRIVLPTDVVRETPVQLDLGGVSVELFSLGRGHTDGDLMVGAPGVLFAGEVLEEGADPQFADSYPGEWAAVLRKLAAMGTKYPIMVPGHGRPVDAAFAAALAEVVSSRGGGAAGLQWIE